MTIRIYLLALVCILTATTEKIFAQNYRSLFGTDSTTWDIILYGFCDAACSSTITVTGDTTINKDKYKVISGLRGFVREDTVQGKVWFYDTYYHTEFLVMDLTLNLGDHFVIYDYYNVANSFAVDSVYYVNNKKQVRLNTWTSICGGMEKITFIEGSGPNAGFHFQREFIGNAVYSLLLCHHKNGVKVAGNTLLNETCYECMVGTTEGDAATIKFNLFPNPVHDHLTIEIKHFISNKFNLTIYNLLGNKVYSLYLTDSLTTLHVSNLSSGIYYAVLSDSNSGTHLKFIKD